MLKPTVAAVATAALAAAFTVPPATAQDQPEELVTFHALTPELAHDITQAAMQHCLDQGYQVAVAVTDRWGVPQSLLRARFAGPHTPETAIRKAYTAVSFRSPTTDLVANTASGTQQAGARDIPGVLMLGGGEPMEWHGATVAGVGVSGAPTGEDDAACARAGIEAVQDRMPL